MAYLKGRQTNSIMENGFFKDTPANRAELIKRQNESLRQYNSEKTLKAKLKKAKPNYGYKKNYA